LLVYIDNFKSSFLPLLLPSKLKGPQQGSVKWPQAYHPVLENKDSSADRGNKLL